jgi:hypothetical protein
MGFPIDPNYCSPYSMSLFIPYFQHFDTTASLDLLSARTFLPIGKNCPFGQFRLIVEVLVTASFTRFEEQLDRAVFARLGKIARLSNFCPNGIRAIIP